MDAAAAADAGAQYPSYEDDEGMYQHNSVTMIM